MSKQTARLSSLVQLQELRSRWEASTSVVTEVATDNFAVSVNKVGDRYWVYRYFKMSDIWSVSVDLSDGSADAALKALTAAMLLRY